MISRKFDLYQTFAKLPPSKSKYVFHKNIHFFQVLITVAQLSTKPGNEIVRKTIIERIFPASLVAAQNDQIFVWDFGVS